MERLTETHTTAPGNADRVQEEGGIWSTVLAVLRYAGRRAREKKVAQVASSLTYTTVLSLVPMLAVVLSLFTAFPLFSEFRYALESYFSTNVMPEVVSETVMTYLNEFAAKASGLTAIGTLFLIVTSVMLFRTIDEAFNDIWQVETRRPLRQRMLVYWALLSLGPILAGASVWALSMLARESMGLIGDLPALGTFALSIIPMLLAGCGYSALFFAVPNRTVRWRDAMIGGFCTAIVLETLRVGIAYYLTRFPSYTIIYGAFATIPIFLLWVYLSWLVILLGATVTALLPALRQRRWAQQHYTGAAFVDGIRVLHLLWHAWKGPNPGLSISDLCERLSLHQDELDKVLRTLKHLGYAVNTENEGEEVWVLACDPGRSLIQPLIHAWLLDTEQPGMVTEPSLRMAVARSIAGEPIHLDTLFQPAAPYPNPPSWGTMSKEIPLETPGDHYVESQ